MSTLALAALLQISLCAADAETYSEARRATNETGQPMVVMVGADWCAACKAMEGDAISQVRQRGLFRNVAFAHVNMDRENKLANQLTEGGPIPQLIMYRKTSSGWKRRVLVGRQNVETVAAFIQEGVERQAAETAAKAKQPSRPAEEPSQPESAPAKSAPPVQHTAKESAAPPTDGKKSTPSHG